MVVIPRSGRDEDCSFDIRLVVCDYLIIGRAAIVRQSRITELQCRCHLPTSQQGDSVKAVIQSNVSAAIDGSKHVTHIKLGRWVSPRGLSRADAAFYLGISPSKFDELRKDGRVGPARLIDGRKIWDVRELDFAFESFPLESTDAAEDWNVAV